MAEDRQLLTDLRLELQHRELRPVYAVSIIQHRVPARSTRLVDIGVVTGRDNLGQAIIIRLLTPRGELSALGHPEYGSRLHELIGRQNTATTRNLVRLHILESLQLEPRIEEVTAITVESVQGRRDSVNVLLQVKPIGDADTVTIGPFTLEFER